MTLLNHPLLRLLPLVLALGLVSACSPEVGSDAWCTQMKDTPRGEWTGNDTLNFAKHCLVK